MAEWIKVCNTQNLVKDAGVAVLVKGQQIALFSINGGVYALGNFDPIREANVLSRGMTGDEQGELYVASPLHKERYSLLTGKCLDNDEVSIPVYPSKVEDDIVWLEV